MSKVQASTDIDRVKPEEAARFTTLALTNIVEQINGNLSFVENLNGKLLSMAFTSSNADTAAIHGLGRAPSGYLVFTRSASMIVYDGAQSNTASVIYLRASAVGSINVYVF